VAVLLRNRPSQVGLLLGFIALFWMRGTGQLRLW